MNRTALLVVLAAYIAAIVRLAGVAGPEPILDPLDAQPRFVERAILERRFAAALPVALSLQRAYPKDSLVALWLTSIFKGLDRPRDEVSAWDAFARITTMPGDACPAIADAYERMGERERALEQYRHCVAVEPREADRLLDLGEASERGGKRDEALSAFREAARLDPRNPAAARHIARLTATIGP